jgi:plasmid stability protein
MKKSAAPPPEVKERVLHTRIPESLDEAIRARAAGLGMSVSNLVRNVLANALEVVEAAAGLAPPAAARAATAVVLGWQEAVLARNAVCDRCNDILPRGARAAIAVVEPDGAGPRPIRCLPCIEELPHD